MSEWRVEAAEGRFVHWRDGTWTADPQAEDVIRDALAAATAVLATVTGPVYVASGEDDELGIYLYARELLDGARLVRGVPPTHDGGAIPEGAVA